MTSRFEAFERRAAGVVLGLAQTARRGWVGRAGEEARQRAASAHTHTHALRRDAGVRPTWLHAVAERAGMLGNVWTSAPALPAGLVGAVTMALEMAVRDPLGQRAARCPVAGWLEEVAAMEGNPWQAPEGGWTVTGVLARMRSRSPREAADYTRSVRRALAAGEQQAWGWEEVGHPHHGAFVQRASRALGGGLYPRPHWTAVMQHGEGRDAEEARRTVLALRTGQVEGRGWARLARYGRAEEGPAGWRCGGCAEAAVDDVPHALLECTASAARRTQWWEEVCGILGGDAARELGKMPPEARAAVLLGGDVGEVTDQLWTGRRGRVERLAAALAAARIGPARRRHRARHERLVRCTAAYAQDVLAG